MVKYGLIGYKLSHSFSQSYFTEKFKDLGIDALYRNFELDSIEAFPTLPDRYPGLVGMNVTVPYKEAIIPYLDELDPIAEAVGAVNTILVRGGRLYGFNTDVKGFSLALQGWYPVRVGDRALILGTGGAAKAVRYALEYFWAFDEIREVSRSPVGAQLSYQDLREAPEALKDWGLIVNATPVGMYPRTDEAPDLPYGSLDPDQFMMDLIYNPRETRFLRMGREQGCRIKNGMEMLIGQAEQSWAIWQGRESGLA